ncbi:MAG: DISARM system SNF2-like helicase DrmD [Anaerolineae bacterium]|nr:DISARM system SNF2-like helicase DrmD [Anaerolineae bacterium]NUQ04745.1 DEAD/DEAH box helicase [Anaerolineae bacterium]
MSSAFPLKEYSIPEQGQIVQLRHRLWMVQDVVSDTGRAPDVPVSYRVQLECLDDDSIGATLNVIWESEVSPHIYDGQGLPKPTQWDAPAVFESFLSAIRWSTSSLLERDAILSPFHAAIDLEEYQLEPVVRALSLPRVNLLIADDVGLGKTIEASLIVQEMLSRRSIRRILIVCPASLQRQWQDELREKFQLDFRIIDRDSIQQLRREFGVHVNPWSSHPRLITSMDFLKREQPLRLFREGLQSHDSPLRDWDLLIVDEAHNAAPSGRARYAVDSDRTRMLRAIADHFEHRLFLTATPHNGFTESFTALLEILDPLRFSRGPTVNTEQVARVMIRRLKRQIKNALGRRKFAERIVAAIPVRLSGREQQLYDLLDAYTESRLERLERTDILPVKFALIMLKKRMLSSPRAFVRSLNTHMTTLGGGAMGADSRLLERMTQRVSEDWADDTEKSLAEDDALVESSRFFTELTPAEQSYLRQLQGLAAELHEDTKLNHLIGWIDEHLQAGQKWKSERLVIFTEYKDTLDYLLEQLTTRYGTDRLLSLFGGMNGGDRETIKAAFQADPDEHYVRILLATDAASEGLNLQNHCRYLIHYEIPWNPIRMEQRNGRIDRHGQQAETVNVFHFIYEDRADSQFLQTVIDKVQTIQSDLGSVGEIISAQVENAMLSREHRLNLPEHRLALAQEALRTDLVTDEQIRQIRRQLDRTRQVLSLDPLTMASVLDSALRLHNHPGLSKATDPVLNDHAYQLRNLPRGWKKAERSLQDARGSWLDITFDHALARERRDLTLLHLNHPLMKLAIGTFRARVWAEDGEGGLHRVSYRVLPELSKPVVLAYGRMVVVGALSLRLHESLICVGGEINEGQIDTLSADDITRLLDLRYEHPAISRSLGDDLRRLFPIHQRALIRLLEEEQKRQRIALEELAVRRADEVSVQIRTLIDERIREIRERIHREEHGRAPEQQLELFDRDEFLQYEEDMDWLRQKRDALIERRKTEPERVRKGFEIRSARAFPLALLYLLPASLVREEGR